jgi:hypothetical protein
VPDALKPTSGGLNLGYGLLTNPNSTYSCCPKQTVGPFTLSGVQAGPAKLTFSVYYTNCCGMIGANTINLQYRMNGDTWLTPNPGPDYSKVFKDNSGQDRWWAVAYSFPVSVLQGSNTVEIKADGTNNGYPPVLENLELLTWP